MPSRILDIDLDLFVDRRKISGDPAVRPTDCEMTPWDEIQVCYFLEHQCGLSKEKPVRGNVFKEHDELFHHLRREIIEGQVTTPIKLIHADAHADFGMGGCSHLWVLTELLARPIDQRSEDFPTNRRTMLSPANWLLYATANRWFDELIYVHHPDLVPGETGDIFQVLMLDNDDAAGSLQLKRFSNEVVTSYRRLTEFEPISAEPSVPLQQIEVGNYRNTEPFDFVFLTHSPGYVPPAADALIDVIRQYISETP